MSGISNRRLVTAWQAPSKYAGQRWDLLSVIQLRSGRLLLPISYRTHRSWGNA